MVTIATAEKTASKNLVKVSRIKIAWEFVYSVDAREIHIKLWSKQKFTDWIQNRINKYWFIENIDFHKIMKPHEYNKTDYILTIDTAKEIAMVENNDNWRQIRRYFIELEKKLKETNDNKVSSISEALNLIYKRLKSADEESSLLKQLYEISQKQELEIENLRKKVDDQKIIQTNIATLWTKEIYVSIEELAKSLWMTRPKLFKELRYLKYLKLDNKPYKHYLDKFFKIVDTKYLRWTQNYNYKQTVVTQSWIEFFTNLFKKSIS